MSVYKSRRGEAKVQYLADARELLIFTIRNLRRFPPSYGPVLTNDILRLANAVYDHVVQANKIYLCRETPRADFIARHNLLVQAYGENDALRKKLSILYEVVDEGQNFLKSKEQYMKMFKRWGELANAVDAHTGAVIKSDLARWKGYQAEREEHAAGV